MAYPICANSRGDSLIEFTPNTSAVPWVGCRMFTAPYLKEKGYTFPVLPAHNLVNGKFDLFGIPQA